MNTRNAISSVITHNVVAVRAEANGNAEQITQAIFGDPVFALETDGDYTRIRMADAYEGWALSSHLAALDAAGETSEAGIWPGLPAAVARTAQRIVVPFADANDSDGNLRTRLVFGSRVVEIALEAPVKRGRVAIALRDEMEPKPAPYLPGYVPRRALSPVLPPQPPSAFRGSAVMRLAFNFVGTPYLWGGTTPFGFDCSGLVQRAYAAFGVLLPRDAYLQAQSPLGTLLPSIRRLRPADLLFFAGANDPMGRGITHVGLSLGDNWFLHASGREGVVVESLTSLEIQRRYTCVGAWRYRAGGEETTETAVAEEESAEIPLTNAGQSFIIEGLPGAGARH